MQFVETMGFFHLERKKDSARLLSFFFSLSVMYFYGSGLESDDDEVLKQPFAPWFM